jgi:hypothetical protein
MCSVLTFFINDDVAMLASLEKVVFRACLVGVLLQRYSRATIGLTFSMLSTNLTHVTKGGQHPHALVGRARCHHRPPDAAKSRVHGEHYSFVGVVLLS